MQKILIGMLLSFFSISALAIDGYKGIKFGSSVKEVLDANICSLKQFPDMEKIPETQEYGCFNLPFGGKNTLGMAFFIDGKFKRFAINVDDNYVSVLNGLIEKYGKPSSSNTPEEITAASRNGNPVFVRFDNDTIFIRLEWNVATGKESALLIYTSHDFDKLMALKNKKSIINDI
ncbi:TPA: hypothetical protein VEO38_003557 [Providencia alcalifaciens]|nr:hypothetical protein [Providencia alcalifaciens]